MAKAARLQALAEQRVVERAAAQVGAELAAARRILDRAQVRHAARQPMDGFATRSRWRARGATRRNRVLDAETQAETRNGFRAPRFEAGNPARPAWAVYRERVLTEAYGAEVGRALGRWVRVDMDRRTKTLHIHNKGMDITDHGDRVVAGMGGNDKEIAAMLQIAGAKGWKALTLTGDDAFQMRAGAAALAVGFTLTDGDLAARIAAQQEKEVQAQRVRDLEAAPILAEWMRAHPKQAQAQRQAGGHIPFSCPEGLDRVDLQRPDVWKAADAWSVGRYGKPEQIAALKKDPDPLKARAVDAGREAALNVWAQRGITLRVGKDAPSGIRGLGMSRTAAITRSQVKQWAGEIQDRQRRSGVSQPIAVTFGKDVTDKVLVLEHLLRQSVPLDETALADNGDWSVLDEARGRLKTHEPDGVPQVWYTRELEQDRLANIRADRVKKLDALAVHLERHGSEGAARYFQEAGFVKDERGFTAYPDPDLPGVQKAWDALNAAQRREFEADVQKRADSVGYREESEQRSKEQRAADPDRQRLVQEIKDDPSLEKMVDTAYRQGKDRAKQDRKV
ncbi:LPD7 domain-containing protein, partial [Acidithiobacillus ferrivorans]|uniref:LPD7 domain-containing protein n=1 Tax=Acidithiobacillus ferrivorans TaxID=160808 RepID=UPI000A755815